MDIIIGSEGKGILSSKVINYILHKINYKNIIYKNSNECEFIIIGHFLFNESIWNSNKKNYIIYSGESFFPKKNFLNNNINNRLYIGTTSILSNLDLDSNKVYIYPTCNFIYSNFYYKKLLIKKYKKYIKNYISFLQNIFYSPVRNYIYVPFCLFSNHIYKNRKFKNRNRKYFLAYCSSRPIYEREYMFDLFVKKKGIHLCHSFGKCYGRYKNTKIKDVPEGFMNEDLIDIYKDYKFVLTMENECKDGYITEKIINAFYSGAIPIYWGSKNINDFFNPESFINVNNFKSFEDCVNYVVNMTNYEIYYMTKQNIYKNNDVINLINDDYNNKNDNKILKKYCNIMHGFLNYNHFDYTILQIAPDLEVGGVQTNTIQEALILKKNFYNSFVISNGGNLVNNLLDNNVFHIKLNVESKNPFFIFINIFYLIYYIRKYDVKIVHARSRAGAWSAFIACLFTDALFITTFHGFYSGYDYIIKKQYNKVMTYGEKIIVSTDFMKNHIIQNYQIDSNKIIKINRGIDTKLFQNISVERINIIKKKYNIQNEKIIVLPGRLTKWKGHVTFIKSMKLLDNKKYKFLIIGDGCSTYKNKLQNMINDDQLNALIDTDCQDIHALYNLADIILNCSTKEETFGRVNIEAQASGKIIISTNIGGSKELINHKVDGYLIEPNNEIELSNMIIYALNNPLNVKNIINNAEKYDISHYEKNILKLYSDISK